MYIKKVDISNFRALETVSIPLSQFSVLIGENDVGKTSFLFALEKFFIGKKLTEPKDWFKEDTSKDIRIVLTFDGRAHGDDVKSLLRNDGTIVISKVFSFEKAPSVTAVLDDKSAVNVPIAVQKKWFAYDSFHFIPVRRDLAVQFSMNKTALLGKTLRARMKQALDEGSGLTPLNDLESTLKASLDEPRIDLEGFLQEQMHNTSIKLGFEDLEIDPIEGISFKVKLSDDRIDTIPIENRGAGTQNNLIIALFRLIAQLNLGGYMIFAMEEPENSLHPKAQRQLLTVIQQISLSSQVIVTTHSPVFIDRTKFENNVLLTRTAKGNTVAKTFDPTSLEQVRTDLGIRASDALLKGGGNCAILVEGSTEEDGFPIFMEMLGMSEFALGIAIINLRGSDRNKLRSTARLLNAYDIPCVIVLDDDAEKAAEDIEREAANSLPNVRHVFRLKEGTIEDYYPLEIVAEILNKDFAPKSPIEPSDFDATKHGKERLSDFRKVMHEHGAGDSLEYLKSQLGTIGTKLMQERGLEVPTELKSIFAAVDAIVKQQ
jgi:putative ATP-dependent endonuclease of the OLD family